MFRIRSNHSNVEPELAPTWVSIDEAMPPAPGGKRVEDPYFGPRRSFGGRCYRDQWRSPANHGQGALDGSHPWTAIARLQDTMTPVGLEWLALRRESSPGFQTDGKLPPVRRLWEYDGGDGGEIGLLHASDEFIAIACSRMGTLLEVWASPTAEAYAESYGISAKDARERLGVLRETIFHQASYNSQANMIVGFTVNGERAKALDWG